jgi:hydrogenase maturation protease
VIVDAVKGGGVPGQIYRFHPEDITLNEKPVLSLHDMSLIDNLRLVQLWHNMGEAVVIGVEPGELSWGLELSSELQQKIPRIIDAILEELDNTDPKGEMKC